MSKDWYARKLGVQPARPSPAQPTQQQPQQQQGLQPFQQQPSTPQEAGQAALARGDVAAATQFWQGGEGTRTETSHCPQCGSPNYFSRQNRNAIGGDGSGGASGKLVTVNGVMSVAARCFDCNYNGMYDLKAN